MTDDRSDADPRESSAAATAACLRSADAAACLRLAHKYLARRAASKHQMRRYLARKLASERDETARQDIRNAIEAVLERLERAGFLDDAALAQSRASVLVRKGLPRRRMRHQLATQGFDVADPALDGAVTVDDESQALRYAERKRLGPFGSGLRAPSFERDVRALVRAGFSPDLSLKIMRRLVAADSEGNSVQDDEHGT